MLVLNAASENFMTPMTLLTIIRMNGKDPLKITINLSEEDKLGPGSMKGLEGTLSLKLYINTL